MLNNRAFVKELLAPTWYRKRRYAQLSIDSPRGQTEAIFKTESIESIEAAMAMTSSTAYLLDRQRLTATGDVFDSL